MTMKIVRLLLAAAASALASPSHAADTLSLADLPAIQLHAGAMQVFYSDAMRGSSPLVNLEQIAPEEFGPDFFDKQGYFRKLPPKCGVWYMLPSSDKLHGVYVLTWEGDGDIQFKTAGNREEVLLKDTANRRIVVRNPEGVGARVELRSTTPGNHVRNVRCWCPIKPGGGAGLTKDSDLAVGKVKDNLEPAPGAKAPLFHPIRMAHMLEGKPGVIRFMGMSANISGTYKDRIPNLTWDLRTPPDYATQTVFKFRFKDKKQEHPARFGYKNALGICYEDLIELCNQSGADLWLQVPHDVDSSFVANLAALVAKNLRPERRVWLECSNEIWNPAPHYLPQVEFAKKVYADAHAHEGDYKIIKTMGPEHAWGAGNLQGRTLKTFRDAWLKAGQADDRFIGIVAGFQGSATYNKQVYDAAEEVEPGIADVFAITTYFANAIQGKLAPLGYDDKGDAPLDVFRQAALLVQENIVKDIYPRWQATAKAIPVPVVAYEGGQHILTIGYKNNHPGLLPFVNNLNRHPLMGDLYRTHWHLWKSLGCGTPSLFLDIGPWSFFGAWGAKESIFDTDETHSKWKAYRDWSRTEPAIRPLGIPQGATPAFQTQSLRVADCNQPFSADIVAGGGDGQLAIEHVGGLLPKGVSFADLGGGKARLSGTPSEIGDYTLVLRALDADKDPAYAVLTLRVGLEGISSNSLVNFDGSTITEQFRCARPVQTTAEKLLIPFGIADADAFFNESYDQKLPLDPKTSNLNFYGGYEVRIQAIEGLERKNTPYVSPNLEKGLFQAYHAGTMEVATDDCALLVWRKDQFQHFKDGKIRFGDAAPEAALQIELSAVGAGGSEIRFVVNNGGKWFVSEAVHRPDDDKNPGIFTLQKFNQRGEEGFRWAEFSPKPNDFRLPAELDFKAVDFNDVQAVGLYLQSKQDRWGWSLGFKNFIALGTTAD